MLGVFSSWGAFEGWGDRRGDSGSLKPRRTADVLARVERVDARDVSDGAVSGDSFCEGLQWSHTACACGIR